MAVFSVKTCGYLVMVIMLGLKKFLLDSSICLLFSILLAIAVIIKPCIALQRSDSTKTGDKNIDGKLNDINKTLTSQKEG